MVPEAPALQSNLDMIPRAGGPETDAVHGSPRARSWRRSGYAANAEGAGERPAAHDGARQRNDELRGRRLRASLVVRLRVVGSRHRQGAHRGGEDQDTEQGRPASLTCPSRIMVPRERPTRPGPGTDELRRRRLLAVPAALVRDVHGLLARDARASRRRHRAVGERLQQLPSPLPRADRRRQAGRGGGGRPAARLSHHLARRGVPVADQHDVQEPHGHRRRGDDPRPAHGCGGARRRLRQDRAGAADGPGLRRRAGRAAARGTDDADGVSRRAARRLHRPPALLGQVPRARAHRHRDPGDRGQPRDDGGHVRGHGHRGDDGVDRGDARHGAARHGGDSRRACRPAARRGGERPPGGRARGGEASPLADHHREVRRERASRAAGDRRAEQRHHPSHRDRRPRRRTDLARAAQRDVRLDAGARRPQAHGPALHVGPARGGRRRRRAARAEAAAAPGLPHGLRRDAGRAAGSGARLGGSRGGAAARRSLPEAGRPRRAVRLAGAGRRDPAALGRRSRAVRARGPGGGLRLARRPRRTHRRAGPRREARRLPRPPERGAQERLRDARGRLPADPGQAGEDGREGHGPHLRRTDERHRLRHHRAARVARGRRRGTAGAREDRRPHPPERRPALDQSDGRRGGGGPAPRRVARADAAADTRLRQALHAVRAAGRARLRLRLPQKTGADSVNPRRITGVLSPVVTPFKADLSPDAEKFVRQCTWLLSQNVGLAVFGTNSEANSLATEEKIELLDRLIAAGLDPARMMPGTGCCAITDSVRLTKHAVKLGCGGVLMLPPFYYKGVSDDGLFRNFAEIVERVGDSGLRIYLYHIPPVSSVPITLTLIERLLKAYPGTIAGAKDSSGDWNNTKAMLDQFAKSGFDVFPGAETFLLAGLRSGGAGCISATANTNPAAIARLYDTWRGADADAQQKRLDEIRGTFAKYPMIPALKAAIAHWSGIAEWATVRPPLVALTREQAAALVSDLKARNFDMPRLRG